MKQKSRFKNFRNISIGYPSMLGRYIGIGPKKAISVDLYVKHKKMLRIFCFQHGNFAAVFNSSKIIKSLITTECL